MEEENLDYEEDDGQYEEGGGEGGETKDESQDPEAMKRRVEEMENELEKLTKMQQHVERQINTAADKIDENSIYIGQVDYEATIDELRAHFAPCGTLNRITIVCDPVTHHPKGFAYIEFANKEGVENALKLDDTLFKGRQLKVLPKRQNVPVAATRGRGRGGGRFGGRGGGGRSSGGRFGGGGGRYAGRFGGRRGGRGGRGSYHPSYY